jgi:glycosyltransferase involved in cell wall biosynthesis
MGGIPDWLVEGRNGFFIKRADELDIAKKVLLILKKNALGNNIPQQKRLSEHIFSKENHMKKLKEIYFD